MQVLPFLFNHNGQGPVISHEHIDAVAAFWQWIHNHKLFFDDKQNHFYLEMQIRRIMNRIADPTDRPFNSTSSPDNSYAIKDTHAAATSGDQAYITVRNLYVRWSMHMDYYPVVGG